MGLLLFLTFSVYACYTDIRYKKIRNLTSFSLVYTGILLLGINVVQNNHSSTSAVICIFVAFSLGIGLYMMRGIRGGDAKFFIGQALVLSALIPSKSIQLGEIVPFVFLLNTLVVYVIFAVLLALSVLPQFNEILKTFSNQLAQGWQSLKPPRARALTFMIWNMLSGILTFLAVLYTIKYCMRFVGYSEKLFPFLLAMLVVYYLNILWKRLRLGNVWKFFVPLIWMVHLSLNVRFLSLTFKGVWKTVMLITVFMFVYKLGKHLVTQLSERALTQFGYASVSQGNSSIQIRFAPFLSLASLLTIWAEGGLYKLFIF